MKVAFLYEHPQWSEKLIATLVDEGIDLRPPPEVPRQVCTILAASGADFGGEALLGFSPEQRFAAFIRKQMNTA